MTRVKYDREKKRIHYQPRLNNLLEITKINDKFDFKKTIYVDRFLFKNKEKTKQINNEVKRLRQ